MRDSFVAWAGLPPTSDLDAWTFTPYERNGQVLAIAARLEPVQEPEPLLGQRERRLVSGRRVAAGVVAVVGLDRTR